MSPASRLSACLAGGLALLLASPAPAQPAAAPAAIDLPTALRLAGAANLEVRLAQEKIAEARAASDLVRHRFLPWITPSVTVRRHEENVQAVNGPVFTASPAASDCLSAVKTGPTNRRWRPGWRCRLSSSPARCTSRT